MKKKIINGFLMVALLAATVTSFVSCKDNNEDVKTDLLAQINLQKCTCNQAWIAADQDLLNTIQSLLAKKLDSDDPEYASLKTDVANLKTNVSNLQTALNNLNIPSIDNLVDNDTFNQAIGEINTAIDTLASKGYVDRETEKLWDALNDLTDPTSIASKMKDVYEKLSNVDGKLSEQGQDIKDIQKDLGDVENKLKDLQNQIDAIVNALKDMITSVTVNATSTTLLANSKLFPGLNVQFVGAAFGQAVTATGEFPSTEADLDGNKLSDDYINITEGEKYEWENGIINNDENNAGKIYFTINPSNVSENVLNNAVSLSLTNSQNDEEIVTLDNVKKSNKILTWGTTRGESEVTLFEADATYDLASAKAIDPKEMIDFASLASSFKSIVKTVKETNKSNAKSNAKSVLKETAQIVATLVNTKIPSLPALALKAEWKDTVGTRNVISDYSLAATAYKPLSFNFGKVNGEVLPTVSLNRIDNAVFKFANNIKSTLNEFINKIKDTDLNFTIDLSGLDESSFNVKKTIFVIVETGAKTITYNVKEGDEIKEKTETVTTIKKIYFTEDASKLVDDAIEITSSSIELAPNQMYYNKLVIGKDLSAEIATIKNAVEAGVDVSSIEALLADAVKALDDANKGIDNATSLVDRATDYLESIINGAINFVNKGGVARALEPVLLVDTQKGIKRATGKYQAGEFTFIPTTMTYEFIAPAFKKYIAIIDNTGKARFGKVLTKGDNDFSAVKLNLQQNDVKLVYAAMDFTGRQIIKEYDIKVK
jgi:peptidoglycan hydrolase CwlO-like protein